MGADSNGAGTNPADVKQIIQWAANDWLALRRPADAAARQSTVEAISQLDRYLANRLGSGVAATIMDLGAGTGANMEWLAPRLGIPQRWTLIDRDEDLLARTSRTPTTRGVGEVRRVAAELDDLLADRDDNPRPDLVTCSAFLDVLTLQQVGELCAFVVRTGAAALFSLTVTGIVRFTPDAAADTDIGDSFNAHQGRHGLAGPAAIDVAVAALRGGGLAVETIDTPWTLDGEHLCLTQRYLRDRVDAVIEQQPALARVTQDWLEIRLRQIRDAILRVEVGHLDLLALPPNP